MAEKLLELQGNAKISASRALRDTFCIFGGTLIGCTYVTLFGPWGWFVVVFYALMFALVLAYQAGKAAA